MNNQQLTRLDSLSRALIGFDTMFDQMERRFANQVSTNYPPFNILKWNEDQYEIQIAITGFEKEEIRVEVEQNQLTVYGESKEMSLGDAMYIHRGLATRDFERTFTLAEHMEVKGAVTKNGMLRIQIIRNIPESAKPKIIDIVEVK
jgi:molecular chaperone IbpA